MKKNTWLGILIGGLAGVLCITSLAIAVRLLPAAANSGGSLPAAVTVLPAAAIPPTIVPTATLAPELAATLANLPPDPGANIRAGSAVHISGTGGDGLRVRRDPGIHGEPLFLAAENEEFNVTAGPQIVDQLTWWYIVAPYDDQRQGWAAANYLSPSTTP
jgi:hypothetical protein